MDVHFGTFVMKTFGTMKFAFLSNVEQWQLLLLINGYDFYHSSFQIPVLRPSKFTMNCHCRRNEKIRATRYACVYVLHKFVHISITFIIAFLGKNFPLF